LVRATAICARTASFVTQKGRKACVAGQVMTLDPVNPHLSSALANAFNQWQRFAEPRRTLQKAALERIGQATALSPDVREIVARNLAG
jgi:aminopeptidase N